MIDKAFFTAFDRAGPVCHGLPGAAYTSGEFFELEASQLFAASWSFVGFAHQLANVLAVAERLGLQDAWRQSAASCLVGSVGPTATSALQSAGLRVDIEPAHPKMGPLVRETILEAISRTRPPSSPGAR